MENDLIDTRTLSFFSGRKKLHIDKDNPLNEAYTHGMNRRDFYPPSTLICFTRAGFLFYSIVLILQFFFSSPLHYSITLVPVLLVLVSSALLDLVVLYRRRKTIFEIDKRKVTVLREHKWDAIPWRALCVGDIIKLNNGDIAPADLILFKTGNGGQCVIDTHIIDGSNQLKARKPSFQFMSMLQKNDMDEMSFCNIEDVEVQRTFSSQQKLTSKIKFSAQIKKISQDIVSDYNNDPYSTDNSIGIRNTFNFDPIPITNSQFIERYSIIYQVSNVICGVVYTGKDCRNVEKNEYFDPVKPEFGISKMSKLEKYLNIYCSVQICLIFLASTSMALFSFFYLDINRNWPFYFEDTSSIYFLRTIWNFINLLLPLCPIEIYIFVDLVLYIHSLFISSYSNEKPSNLNQLFGMNNNMNENQVQNEVIQPRSFLNTVVVPNIPPIDDLSHVDTIIVSKNILIDKKINILRIYLNGIEFGQTITSYQRSHSSFNLLRPPNSYRFEDDRLATDHNTNLFFLHLALCHSAMPIIVNEFIGYVSNFVEDEPLLKLAESYNFVFTQRGNGFNGIQVKIFGDLYWFPVLITFPPSPTHSRMSIIFRDLDGSVKLFIRGEFDFIRDFLIKSDKEKSDKLMAIQKKFKNEGLRVICCAYKVFSNEEIQELQKRIPLLLRASPAEIFGFANNIEQNCEFLSFIALEEEPHSGCVELIRKAKHSGIQIVLTSPQSSQSTTVSALSVGLLDHDQSIAIINGRTEDEVSTAIEEINSSNINAIMISGHSIEFLPKIACSYQLFRDIKFILIESAEPHHSADFVQFLKSLRVNKVVLGIGESIYDSLYMRTSNISVSLRIDTISTCSLHADIVINNLNEASSLIFKHGSLLRERISSMIHYVFAKNTFFSFISCVYGFYSAFSGTPLFEALQFFIFNGITSTPILSRAIFNQNKNFLIHSSIISTEKHKNFNKDSRKFSFLRFFITTILALIGASILVYLTKLILMNSRGNYGDTLSISEFSFAVESILVVCNICFIGPTCRTWNTIHHLLMWVPPILFFVITRMITDNETSGQSRGCSYSVTSTISFIELVLLFAGISSFFVFSYILWKRILSFSLSSKKIDSFDQMIIHSQPTLPSSYIQKIEQIFQ